jgi:hypothetical protein
MAQKNMRRLKTGTFAEMSIGEVAIVFMSDAFTAVPGQKQ